MSNSDKRDSEGFLSTVILRFEDDDDDDDEEEEDEQVFSAAMLIYENKEQWSCFLLSSFFGIISSFFFWVCVFGYMYSGGWMLKKGKGNLLLRRKRRIRKLNI